MQRLYVITFKQGRYSSQVIGATTDSTKISAILADYVDSIKDTVCDADISALNYLADPTNNWYVSDAPVGKTICSGKGKFGVEITVTTLM